MNSLNLDFRHKERNNSFAKHLFLFLSILIVFVLFYQRAFPGVFYIGWIFFVVVNVFVLSWAFKRGAVNRQVSKTFGVMSPWLVSLFVITPFAVDSQQHSKASISLLFYVFSFSFLSFFLLKDKLLLRKTFISFFWFWVSLNTFLLILYGFDIISYEKGNFAGPFTDRTWLGFVTCIILTAYLFLSSEKKHYSKIFAIGVSSAIVISTLSLKSFLGLFFSIFLWSFFVLRFRYIVLVACAAFLALAVVFLTPNQLSERFKDFSENAIGSDNVRVTSSGAIRVWAFFESYNIFKENPITGVGFGGSSHVLIYPYSPRASIQDNIARKGISPHNSITGSLMTMGLPATLFYYTPLFYVLIRVIGRQKKDSLDKLIISLLLLKLFFDFGEFTIVAPVHVFILVFSVFYLFSSSVISTNNRTITHPR